MAQPKNSLVQYILYVIRVTFGLAQVFGRYSVAANPAAHLSVTLALPGASVWPRPAASVDDPGAQRVNTASRGSEPANRLLASLSREQKKEGGQ